MYDHIYIVYIYTQYTCTTRSTYCQRTWAPFYSPIWFQPCKVCPEMHFQGGALQVDSVHVSMSILGLY